VVGKAAARLINAFFASRFNCADGHGYSVDFLMTLKSRKIATRRNSHLGGILLLVFSFCIGIAIWIAVQSGRQDPLPTLVWASTVPDTKVIEMSPIVLDRLGAGWWWIYATPTDRQRLRDAGVGFAFALPTPLAQMAGCSVPVSAVTR
jgi:hypothetical protein